MDKHNELARAYDWQLIYLCLTSKHEMDKVNLEPSDMLDDRCREIWAFIRDKKEINLNEVGVKFDYDNFVSDLLSGHLYVHDGYNTESVVSKIKELAHRRRVYTALKTAAGMLEGDSKLENVSTFTTEAFDDVEVKGEAQHIKEFMKEAYQEIQDANEGKSVCFVPTGYTDIDYCVGGLQQDGLIIVAGRPGMGKTAFTSNLTRNIAKHGDVLQFSMEMSGKLLAMRYLAAEEGVDLQLMMQGKLEKSDWQKLSSAMAKLVKLNIYINDKVSSSMGEIATDCRRHLRTKGKLQAVTIDYLGLLDVEDKGRHDLSIAAVTRSAKKLAKELSCPVILLCQLNRELEKREDKLPKMSDLRDSGAIEQDADQVVFPYRPCVYEPDNVEHKLLNEVTGEITEKAIVKFAKNRNGRTGEIDMMWRPISATYASLDVGLRECTASDLRS
jgi:replicative DNA helicase